MNYETRSFSLVHRGVPGVDTPPGGNHKRRTWQGVQYSGERWQHPCSEYMDITPWNRMHIYWVDERCVPPADSDSNYGMMRNLLLGLAPIPYENVFRIRGEAKPLKEAVRYSELVKKQVPFKQGWPEFDIILLGAGDDGHTSSIFPGQEDLLTSNDIYVLSTHPRNGQKRIAMTGYPILNARHVIFLITGKSKADVVEEICNSGDTGPAAYIAHHAQNVELFMDKGAALYIDDLNKKDLN